MTRLLNNDWLEKERIRAPPWKEENTCSTVGAISFFPVHVFSVTMTPKVLVSISFASSPLFVSGIQIKISILFSDRVLGFVVGCCCFILLVMIPYHVESCVVKDWHAQGLNLVPELVRDHLWSRGHPEPSIFFPTHSEGRGPLIWSWWWKSPNV